jgi:uncharacterized Zn-binding protein involved in type VI secretion
MQASGGTQAPAIFFDVAANAPLGDQSNCFTVTTSTPYSLIL